MSICPVAFILSSSEGVPIAYSDEALRIGIAVQVARCASIALATLHMDSLGDAFDMDLGCYLCKCCSVYVKGRFCLIILLSIKDNWGDNSEDIGEKLPMLPSRSINLGLYMVCNWISGIYQPFFYHILSKLTEYSFRNVESSTFASSVEDKADIFNCNSEIFWGSISGEQFQDGIVDCLRVFKDATSKLLHDLSCSSNSFWFHPILSLQSNAVQCCSAKLSFPFPIVYLFSCGQKTAKSCQIIYASKDYYTSHSSISTESGKNSLYIEAELGQLVERYIDDIAISDADKTERQQASKASISAFSLDNDYSPSKSPAERSNKPIKEEEEEEEEEDEEENGEDPKSPRSKLDAEVDKMNASMRVFICRSFGGLAGGGSTSSPCALDGLLIVLAMAGGNSDLVQATVFPKGARFCSKGASSSSSSFSTEDISSGGGSRRSANANDVISSSSSKYLIKSYEQRIESEKSGGCGNKCSSDKYLANSSLRLSYINIYNVDVVGADVKKELRSVNYFICRAISRDAAHLMDEQRGNLCDVNCDTDAVISQRDLLVATKTNNSRKASAPISSVSSRPEVSLSKSGSSGGLRTAMQSSGSTQALVLEELEGDDEPRSHSLGVSSTTTTTIDLALNSTNSQGKIANNTTKNIRDKATSNNVNTVKTGLNSNLVLYDSNRLEDCIFWMSNSRLVEGILFPPNKK